MDKQTEASMHECLLHIGHGAKHLTHAFKTHDTLAVIPHLTFWESEALEAKLHAQGHTKQS